MEGKEKMEKGLKEEKHYICEVCKKKYELTEARRKELACCGQPLLKTEVIAKSSPEPFGP